MLSKKSCIYHFDLARYFNSIVIQINIDAHCLFESVEIRENFLVYILVKYETLKVVAEAPVPLVYDGRYHH